MKTILVTRNPGKRSPKGKYDDDASLEGRNFIPEPC